MLRIKEKGLAGNSSHERGLAAFQVCPLNPCIDCGEFWDIA